MEYEEFKGWVAHYAVHGEVPSDVRDKFDRMIEEDEMCSLYFDAHLKLDEYLRSLAVDDSSWKGELQKGAKFALTCIESGVSPGEVPKKFLDALVYVLADTAVKAWRSKDYSKALNLLNQILLYRPDDRTALILLGNVHYDMGEYEESAGYSALALDSGELEEELRPMVLSHLGLCHAQLGDFDKAWENLEKAKEMAPEDGDVLNNLGLFYLMRSRYPEALDVLKKAENFPLRQVREFHKNATVLGNIAMAYYELGDKNNALRYIHAALALDPESDKLLHNEEIISGAKEGALLYLV